MNFDSYPEFSSDMSGLADLNFDNYPDMSGFTGVPDPVSYPDMSGFTDAPDPVSFTDPNAVLTDIAYQGDTTQPNNVSANPRVDPADVTRMINADSTGILRQLFTDKNGNLNLQALGGIGGGILGALGAMQPNVKKVGYQGSIPKYDAVRNMVNAPPTRAQGYRPGQGGINYGGDVSFVPKGTGLAAAPVAPTVTPEIKAAQGGLMGLARGRYLQGETDGMADKIPAKIGQDQPAALSHGEFVIPADVVSHLGNGNSDAGAKKLYSMMDKIRTARTGTKKQGKEINPDKFMPGGLAQAYAGGEVKKFAGTTGSAVTGLGSAAAAGVTGSETTPNTFAGEYIGDMLGKGQALANAPYQQYMGPLTAGESGLQSKVFGGLQNTNFPSNFGQSFSSTGAYAPPQMNMGAYNTQPIGNGPGTQPGATVAPQPSPIGGVQQPQGIASQYMNPYLQSVLDPQMAELRRQNDITNMMSNAKATGMGAFGGGRQAIMNAENNRNLMQEMNKTVGQGYASAYDKAQNQFNVEQGQGMGLARLMADQGAQQRGIEAEGIAADKAAFEAARENPYKMLQFQQSMLQGMPISATNIETATPSKLQQAMAGAGGLAGMFPTVSNVSMKSVTDLLGNLGLGSTPG